jgi:lysophospholipase L1-like esterase
MPEWSFGGATTGGLEVAIVGCVRLLYRERRSGRAVVLLFAAAFMGATMAGCSGATTPASAVVVGIGDSVTAAVNCGCPGFVEPYAKDLPTSVGGPARGVNLGSNGLTAAGLLKLVTTPTADGVAEADTLLVTIGANDLLPLLPKWRASGCPATCYSPAVDAVGSDISGILTAAKSLRGSKPVRILVTNYWNVFADGDVASASETPALFAWSDELTRALNSRICTAARGGSGIYVDLYGPFKGNGTQNPTKFLAGDGDHPNAAGYELITSALLKATPPNS